MARGGKRPNAGRKPGTAWAGQKGPRSKSYQRLMDLGRPTVELEHDGDKKRGVQNLRDSASA